MSSALSFDGARVLITGGCGFIGSNLARRLLQLGANVLLVDSLVPEYGGNLFNIDDVRDAVTLNVADVRDPHSMRYLVQGQDFLFNLAGQTSHVDSMRDPQTDLDINCRAQLTILEACRANNPKIRIVFAGTRQIYGKPEYLPVDERHPVRPVDVNGVNKMAGEWFHLLYNNVHGIGATVLRLTNTYGPRMRIKDARQTFVGVWIRALVEGKPFEVWGGEQLRDFTHVDDAVEAFLLAAARDDARGKIYNLGGKEVVSLKALADTIVAVNGGGHYDVRTFPEERRRIDIGDYYSDFALIKRELGWQPAIDLKHGVAATLSFYRDHVARYI